MYCKLILKQLMELEAAIKESKINIWCDRIPEWQMLITNLLQYLLTAETNKFNYMDNEYLKESLQYYGKINNYFDNPKVQNKLYLLFELIKKEINYQENFQSNYIQEEQKNCVTVDKYFLNPQRNRFFLNNMNNLIKMYHLNQQVNQQRNLLLFQYRCNLQKLVLKNKFKNILNSNIINNLLSKFNFKNYFQG